ncbi:MAG: AbrB/MazE/SpoVT family DNA-binding domain-containing protein [Syntrophomonadaceae bacterium]|nr:AbrB/MazE/SpoVT family DNA-binding domain-containing protein [Syntrophomonadaceae bacterium]
MSVAKVGKRGVVVLPAELRKRMKINEGDELLIDISESGVIYMVQRPDDFVAALKNAGRGLWAEQDPVAYVREERETW